MVVREALATQATSVRTSVLIPSTRKAKLWQHEPGRLETGAGGGGGEERDWGVASGLSNQLVWPINEFQVQ